MVPRRFGLPLFLLAVSAFFGAFLVYPTLYVFKAAFWIEGEFTLRIFTNLFRSEAEREAIYNSFALSLVSTFLTFLVSLPLALIQVRYRFPGKALLSGFLLVPMIMPPFVGAIGMKQIFSRFGSLNLLLMNTGIVDYPVDFFRSGFWGVVILQILHLYPIMYLALTAAMANIDPALEEAGRNLGGSGWFLFRRIHLPLLTPGILAGSSLVFIWAFTDLGTPLVMGYRRTVPVQIFDRLSGMGDNPETFALVVLVILLTLGMFLLMRLRFGGAQVASVSRGIASARERDPGAAGTLGIYLFLVGLVFASMVPHLSVVLYSFREDWFLTVLPEQVTLENYRTALTHELTLPSIRNSLFYSVGSTLVDILLGIPIAYILVRSRFRGKSVLEVLTMLPLALPGLVIAFGYLAGFSGTFLSPLKNPVPLLVISYAVRRLPYMVRAVYAGLQQVSVTLEEASLNLGAGPLRTLRRITVPLVGANLVAGAILTFCFSMLEVSDSLILALQDTYYPITKAIWELLARIEDGPYVACALGVWAMLLLALGLLLAGSLFRGKMGNLFRSG